MLATEAAIRESIITVFRQNDIAPVKTVRSLAGGVENHVYTVNEQYVIRLHDNNPRYATEAAIYHRLATTALPVPTVVAYDVSKSTAPFDYMITTLLGGIAAHPAWRDLSTTQQYHLADAIGTALATIHMQQETHCWTTGKIYNNWSAVWSERFAAFCNKMHAHRSILNDTIPRLRHVVEAHQSLFDNVQQAALLHGDYQLTNLLQQDGELTGIIDMEWAHGGDPAWDFTTDYHWRKYCAGSAEIIYAAYRRVHDLDDDAQRRIAIYRLLPMIEDAVYAHSIGWHDGKGWHWSFAHVQQHLTELENSI